MAHQSPTNLWKNITVDNPMSFLKDARHMSESSDSTIFLDQEDDKSEVDFPGVTKTIHKLTRDKKKYHHISNEARLQLIDAVENKNQKIKFAAKTLGINYSSAKSIYQVFKREGRSDKKVFKRRTFNREEDCTQTQDESNFLNLPTEPLISAKTPEVSPIEEKDTLTALRDRLLASKRDSSQSLNAFKFSLSQGDYTNTYNPLIFPQTLFFNNTNATGEINYQQQFEPAKINACEQQYSLGQQQQLQQPLQQTAGFMPVQSLPKLPQGYSGQTIYILAPQVLPSVMMPCPQTSAFNNFNSYIPQNMSVAGPAQTININQPTAKNMNIQTISVPTSKANSFSAYMKQPFGQMMSIAPQVQAQQPQYYSVGLVNPMMSQATGFQAVQTKVLMVPQSNLIQANTYSQVPQNGLGFGTVAYMPSYQGQMSLQSNPIYSTQAVDDNLKVKFDNNAPESSLSTETPVSGFQ